MYAAPVSAETARTPAQLCTALSSAVLVAVAILALGGWLVDVPVLKSIRSDWPAMKGNTAVCFLLAGVSLGLLRATDPSQRARRLAQACAALAGAIGTLTLSEHFLHVDIGLDQLLF